MSLSNSFFFCTRSFFPFPFPRYCFYPALLLFFSVHSFAPHSVFQSSSLSSVTVHLFPFSLSSFLSPLPLTLSLLAPSCLSRGRKSLELGSPTGSHSSSGTSEMEGKGSDLLPLPGSWVARWARGSSSRAAGFAAAEGNSKRRDAHWAPAVAADSLFLPQHGGGSLTMDYLFTVAPSLCLFSLLLEFHPLYYHRAKNLVSAFSLSGVLRGNIICFLGHLWEKPFFLGWRGKIFLLLSCLSIPPCLGWI